MSQLFLLAGEGSEERGRGSESIRVSGETGFFPPYFEVFRDTSMKDDISVLIIYLCPDRLKLNFSFVVLDISQNYSPEKTLL